MMSTMYAALPQVVEMVEHGMPTVIRNERQLEQYTETLFELTGKARPTSTERKLIELYTLLITSYEEQHYSVPEASPLEVLRTLMDSHGVAQKDLTEIGSPALVSLILKGERQLTVDHIRALAKRFNVAASAFIG